jgi:hypothetical protein
MSSLWLSMRLLNDVVVPHSQEGLHGIAGVLYGIGIYGSFVAYGN